MSKRLEEAEQKMKFADFLLGQESKEQFLSGAVKHILKAANCAVAELLAMDEKSSVSPVLAKKKLEEMSPQAKEFSTYFLTLWKMNANPLQNNQDVANAYKRVNNFVQYVKEVRSKI